MLRMLTFIAGTLCFPIAVALYWMNQRHPDEFFPARLISALRADSKAASPAISAIADEANVQVAWSRSLRQPLYDPPPPTPPPPPPPTPPIPIAVLGVMNENGRSFALMKVGNLSSEVVGVGDKVNATGTDVEIVAIASTEVKVRIGPQELIVRREVSP